MRHIRWATSIPGRSPNGLPSPHHATRRVPVEDVELLAARIVDLADSDPVDEMSDDLVEAAARVFGADDAPGLVYPAVA